MAIGDPYATMAELKDRMPVAYNTPEIRFDCPEIARRIVPGQFLMLRLAGFNDPLLGRPFALYDVVRDVAGTPRALDVVYLVIGRGTAALAWRRPGDRLRLHRLHARCALPDGEVGAFPHARAPGRFPPDRRPRRTRGR
mgnify:CR=1 FL=1